MRGIPFSTNQCSEGTTLWVLTCFEDCSFAGNGSIPHGLDWLEGSENSPAESITVWLVVKPFFA